MGRPLNKKFFTDAATAPGSAPGSQIQNVNAYIPGAGSAVTDAWIVKQHSNTTYTVTDGTDTGRCKLTNKSAEWASGEMSIEVSPYAGGTEYVKILNAHQVKTFEGNVYKWSDLAAAADNEADIDLG